MMAPGNFFSVRTTTETLEGLRAAADARSISINREINDRLIASFDDDRNPDKVFSSRALFGLMKLVAAAMQTAGAHALHLDTGSPEHGSEFFRDAYAYDQAVRAAITVLEACRPPGKREPSQTSIDAAVNELKLRVGEVWAKNLLAEVADAKEVGSRGEKLRRDLDPSIINNIKKAGGKK
jgi:hypothetical protein